MAIFDSNIIQLEGGLTNNPQDHGGLTKYGIDQRNHPNVDIANLTLEEAIEIYKSEYWNPNNLSQINDQTTAHIIFALIVNTGAKEAIKIVQNAINTMGRSIRVDGVLGPITYNAINRVDPNWLDDTIRVSECRHYLAIVDANESQNVFFKGWIRRALS